MTFFGIFPLKMTYAVIVIGALTLYVALLGGYGVGQLNELFGAIGVWLYLRRQSSGIVSNQTIL
jgi:hypothetical protein